MLDLNQPEINFIRNAVTQAALLVRHVQSRMVTPALTKEDRSPVTVADYAAQALVGALLSRAYPEARMVAEESSAGLRTNEAAGMLRQVADFVGEFLPESTPERVLAWLEFGRADGGERFWTLDPIDGTKGFLRGDQYAVALALVEGGRVQAAGLGCPNLEDAQRPMIGGAGSIVLAARNLGTWTTPLDGDLNLRRLKVSTQTDPVHARMLRSFESGHTNVDQISRVAAALNVRVEPVRMDSQAKYAVLAAGGGELLLRLISASQPDYKEKIWDQAAGSLVLEEAGGRITDLDGKALNFTTQRSLTENRGVLASNGLLHPAALQALDFVGA